MNRGLNKVMVIGQTESKPDVRYTSGGNPVASFTVTVPRAWTSADGERHEEAEWFNIVAWGNLAELCERQIAAAQQLYIEGRLQTRGWTDENGKQQYRTEVVAHEIITMGDGHHMK
jgi:single-strand DNA-binding protein